MITIPLKIDVLDHGYVRYVDSMGSDRRVVESARVSYDSPSKGDEADKKLLGYLLKNKHTSPFEMCKVTFEIQCPIFVQRQFIRHRMQNFNEVSARYTELPDVFYVPDKFRAQDTKNKQGSVEAEFDYEQLVISLKSSYARAYGTYQYLLNAGVAREQARLCLPVGIYTKFYTCWDLNNLLKYFRLRDDPHAQWEHQEFSRAMKKITAALFPWTMEIYEQSLQTV